MGRYINNNTTSINSLKRIGWIDNLRGFCMLAILLDHTESYYLDYHIINQNLYLTDALVFFFILSGYLMYKPQQQYEYTNHIWHVHSILFTHYSD